MGADVVFTVEEAVKWFKKNPGKPVLAMRGWDQRSLEMDTLEDAEAVLLVDAQRV